MDSNPRGDEAQEQGPLHTFMSVIHSAQSIWKKLNESFSHVDGHKIYQILRDLYTLKQGTDSVDFYYNKLQGLWDELAAIEPQETCNCGSCICGASSRQEEQNQRRQLIQFLMGLNDRYSTVRRQILMMQPLPSVAQAFAIVRQDERQRRGYIPGTNHSTALLTKSFSASNDSNNMVVDNESTALMANSQNRDQFQFKGPKANLWCTYCHKQGHTKDICFKLVGYPTTHSASRWNKAESSFNQFPTSTPKTNSYQKFNSNVPVIANKPGGSANTGAANMTTTEPGNLSDSIQQLLPQMQQLFSMVQQSQSHSSLEDSEEDLADETCTNKDLKTLKILSYNVWFREDLEMHKRMKALGDLIQMHSPDLICLQEVTPNIYDIFQQSGWWKFYKCSVTNEMAFTRPYFCMQLSKMPVKKFSCKPFRNSIMGRELCVAEVVSEEDEQLVIATSHLESPCPGPPKWDQMYSKERVDQAKEAINILKQHNNVIFCGDMNWDDELDGQVPMPEGWIDAWTELRPRELGYTYDTKTNKMLSGNRALQKRLDRFLCCLSDFKIDQIEMIGMEAIPGLSYCKEKKVKKEVKNMILPVLPSDHYGLLLTIRSQ